MPSRTTEAARTEKASLEDKKRQVGSVVFSAEMLNQPMDRETPIFKREWLQYRPYKDLDHPTRSGASTFPVAVVAFPRPNGYAVETAVAKPRQHGDPCKLDEALTLVFHGPPR